MEGAAPLSPLAARLLTPANQRIQSSNMRAATGSSRGRPSNVNNAGLIPDFVGATPSGSGVRQHQQMLQQLSSRPRAALVSRPIPEYNNKFTFENDGVAMDMLKDAHNQNQKLREQIQQLKQEIKQWNQWKEQLQKSYEEDKQQINRDFQELTTSRNRIVQLSAENHSFLEKVQKFQSILFQIHKQIDSRSTENGDEHFQDFSAEQLEGKICESIQTISQKITENEGIILELQKQLEKQGQQLQKSDEELKRLRTDIGEAMKSLQGSENAKNSLQEKFNELKNTFESEKSQAQSRIREITDQKIQENKQHSENLEELQKQIREFQMKEDKNQQILENQQKQIEEFQIKENENHKTLEETRFQHTKVVEEFQKQIQDKRIAMELEHSKIVEELQRQIEDNRIIATEQLENQQQFLLETETEMVIPESQQFQVTEVQSEHEPTLVVTTEEELQEQALQTETVIEGSTVQENNPIPISTQPSNKNKKRKLSEVVEGSSEEAGRVTRRRYNLRKHNVPVVEESSLSPIQEDGVRVDNKLAQISVGSKEHPRELKRIVSSVEKRQDLIEHFGDAAEHAQAVIIPEAAAADDQDRATIQTTMSGRPRRRTRTQKTVQSDDAFVMGQGNDDVTSAPAKQTKRGRGRPRKNQK